MIGESLQFVTALFGGAAIFLRSFERTKRLGYIVGITSSFLWPVLEAYYHLWLVLPVNVLYLYGWIRSYKIWRKNGNKSTFGKT